MATKCMAQMATASDTAAAASNNRRRRPTASATCSASVKPTYAPWIATTSESATSQGSCVTGIVSPPRPLRRLSARPKSRGGASPRPAVLRHRVGNARAARRPRRGCGPPTALFSLAALEPAPRHARYGVAAKRGDTAMLALSDGELCAVGKAFDRAWDNFLRTGALTPKNLWDSRAILAARILRSAYYGERDEWRLARDAVSYLSQVTDLRRRLPGQPR